MIVCLPDAQARADIGPLPDGVRTVVWGEDGASAASFLVAPYRRGSASPQELLAGLPRLEVIQSLSAGIDVWLPLLPATVTLCRGVGVHTASTAELALALTLASLRELPRFAEQQRAHHWQPTQTLGLAGRRVLILGAGDIGRAASRRFEACDAEVTLVARSARDGVRAIAELPELLPNVDVLVLLLPLTEQTRGLIDASLLAKLPDGALVVNVARGSVLLTDALLAELQSGRLRAALDVVEPEPLPGDHPLWSAPNVIITPHVGGGTEGWERRGYALAGEQIRRWATGAPLRYVVTSGY